MKLISKSITLLTLLSIGLMSCGNSIETVEDPIMDEYYVKYESSASAVYSDYYRVEVTIKDENGEFETFSSRGSGSLEMVVGPVSKGFTAQINTNTSSYMDVNLEISVSKNNGPFASNSFDRSDKYRKSASLKHTIDK